MPADTTTSAAAFWDTVGKAYQTAYKDIPCQQRSLEWLLSTLPAASQVADIGCGTGRPICEAFIQNGHHITGVDVSSAMLQAAREQVPQATFVQSSAFDWTPSSPLDAVTAYFSIIANLTQDQIKSFFPLAYSWLKPGGLFVFSTEPFEANMWRGKFLGRDSVGSGVSAEEYVETVRNAGFEVVKVEKEKFLPKGEEAGICTKEESREEDQLFIWAKKPAEIRISDVAVDI
ncbi:hypothetical protein PRZ48_007919 [Zasmidium cellare]|uniref:Methyltransferase domain-containing protein n=1 Tax=Zasmidium cellare TaxID=395010 RepID=A0ABR0EF89_ZASCE|nr:hypothetical protein PRZ48_007919 [Zasmidium cellare]